MHETFTLLIDYIVSNQEFKKLQTIMNAVCLKGVDFAVWSCSSLSSNIAMFGDKESQLHVTKSALAD